MNKYKNLLTWVFIILYSITLTSYVGFTNVEFINNNRILVSQICNTAFAIYGYLYTFIYQRLTKKDIIIMALWIGFALLTGAIGSLIFMGFWFGLRGAKANDLMRKFVIVQTILFVAILYTSREHLNSWNFFNLGFTNPNRTTLHLFACAVPALYLTKDSKYSILGYIAGFLFFHYIFKFTNTRAVYVAYGALALYLIPNFIWEYILPKTKYLLMALPWIMFFGSVVAAYKMNNGDLNDFSSTRLNIWYYYLQNINNKLIGDIGINNISNTHNMLTLDSDFINTYFAFGILGTIVTFAFLSYVFMVLVDKKHYKEIFFIFSLLVYGTMEQVMYSSGHYAFILIAVFVAVKPTKKVEEQ